jgi:hypothetical protein
MDEAEGDRTPIATPDTQPTPPGWVMLVEAFPSVVPIVGDPKVAAEEVWRALLAGRVRSLRRRFLNDSVEDAVMPRTFWRGIKFYAAKDTRGRDVLRICTWLPKGADDSFISKCVFYLWRADINVVWPSAFPAETVLELVTSEPVAATEVPKHTEAAPAAESLKPAEAAAKCAPSKKKKRSRRKSLYRTAPRALARKLLDRMYPEGYPTEDEVSSPDMWRQFQIQYDKYKREVVKPLSTHGIPSQDTMLRAAGRRGG